MGERVGKILRSEDISDEKILRSEDISGEKILRINIYLLLLCCKLFYYA